MSPQQGPEKDRARAGSASVGGTALVTVALGSTRHTERDGISPRYGNLFLSLAAWSHEDGAAQPRVPIVVQFAIDLREAEMSLGHVQFQKPIFSDTKLLTKYALTTLILDLGY